MKETERRAYAKINLALDVLARREDGYHDIKSVMHAIDLYDTVSIRLIESGETEAPGDGTLPLTVTSDLPGLPEGEQNLAGKAARRFLSQIELPEQIIAIDIHVTKRIPVAAGLAGGSADAAAVLLGLNELLDEPLDQAALAALGTQIGADIPFCLGSQQGENCALASGIGEQLSSLSGLPAWAVLVCPEFSLNTAQVYQAFDEIEAAQTMPRPDIDRLIAGLQAENWTAIEEGKGNALWPASLKLLPELEERILAFEHAVCAASGDQGRQTLPLMSGSGPTLFALFSDRAGAEQARRRSGCLAEEVFLVSLDPERPA